MKSIHEQEIGSGTEKKNCGGGGEIERFGIVPIGICRLYRDIEGKLR